MKNSLVWPVLTEAPCGGAVPPRQFIAHVIRCNDSVEFVVIGDAERAEEKKEELKEQHYLMWAQGRAIPSREVYNRSCFWSVRLVDAEGTL